MRTIILQIITMTARFRYIFRLQQWPRCRPPSVFWQHSAGVDHNIIIEYRNYYRTDTTHNHTKSLSHTHTHVYIYYFIVSACHFYFASAHLQAGPDGGGS